VLSLIFIVAFPFVIWVAWKNMKAAKASTSWPTTNGVINANERIKAMFRTQPRITYSYSVNNVPYASRRVSFAAAVPSREIDALLARYPVGQSVNVHYAPGNPAEAALEPGSGPAVVKPFRSLIILFVVFILANVARYGVARLEPAKPHIRTYDDVAAADPKLGDRLIRRDAEKGNAQDQFYVGTWYILGHDVPKDPVEAARWFRKSADQGYADGQVFLGEMYGTGNGVEKNLDEAVSLFRKSAAQNNARACVDLGYSYEKGLGVPQDDKEAANWYRKAAGDPRAQAGLKRLSGTKP
jgi:hypothetical protein